MPRYTTADGLTVHQEGPNARVTAGRLNFLFGDSDRDEITRSYTKLVTQARDYLAPRWQTYSGPNIDAHDFQEITQEVTLHWMYFYLGNHQTARIEPEDWDQPQTRRIIQAAVERRFRSGSEQAIRLCAHLMGISQDEYLQWNEDNDSFLAMW
ncbi:MAG TPA: hypothetical protein VJK02_20515 [Anaerolineales bacterium]|nr:hypothetical protein [Anaerolineales bacterium]HLE04377.1 hypothetical protein [Anaerolineales bacterium]